jgi:hypothetical protein
VLALVVGWERKPLQNTYMSPKYHFLLNALWVAHPVLQSVVLAAMIRRKLYKTFPFFFAYVVAQILIFATLYPLYKPELYSVFFEVYWTTTAVSVLLGFKVIHEVFVDIFRPYHTLRDLGSVLFKWAGLVMLLVAGVTAASSPASDAGPLVHAILTLQRSVRVIQFGLVLFLLSFSKYVGISWRQRSFGVALGFGGFSFMELALLALRSGMYLSETRMNLVNMTAYNAAIVTWSVYMWMKSPVRESTSTLLKSQRWEQSLTDLQVPVAAGSLIPMFEGMVDRAFSRTTKYSLISVERQPDEVLADSYTTSPPSMEAASVLPLGYSREA